MRFSLKEYIQEREMRQTGGIPDNAPFHSKSYRKYFEGYSEYFVKLPNGRTKIERVYTGVYHTMEGSSGKRARRKAGYLALAMISAGLFCAMAVSYVPSNTVWYVTAPEAAAVAILFLLLGKTIGYALARQQMTLYEFRTVAELKKVSRAGAAVLGVLAAIKLVYLLTNGIVRAGAELAGIAACAGAASCCVAIFWLESRNRYEVHLSSAKVPEDAREIYL